MGVTTGPKTDDFIVAMVAAEQRSVGESPRVLMYVRLPSLTQSQRRLQKQIRWPAIRWGIGEHIAVRLESLTYGTTSPPRGVPRACISAGGVSWDMNFTAPLANRS